MKRYTAYYWKFWDENYDTIFVAMLVFGLPTAIIGLALLISYIAPLIMGSVCVAP